MREDLSSRRSARSSSIVALKNVLSGSPNPADLDSAAQEMKSLANADSADDPLFAFGRLLEALAMAVQWQPAIEAADANPSRFRDAAHEIAVRTRQETEGTPWPTELVSAAERVAAISDPTDVAAAAFALLECPLPVRLGSKSDRRARIGAAAEEHGKESESPAPIFMLMSLDGEAIASPVVVRPHDIYTLEASIRVSKWPASAVSLVVDLVGVASQELIHRDTMTFVPEKLTTTSSLQVRGNIQPPGKTEEFRSYASYRLADGRIMPVSVVGHPTLKIATFDPSTALPRQLPHAAERLMTMMSVLDARLPTLDQTDRKDLFTLLESLVRYANGALREHWLIGPDRISEKEFQERLKAHFTADPGVGAALKEATHEAGGIIDLALGRVILELKVEHAQVVTLEDAAKYVSQPAHYGSSTDSPVSILCILDDSPKGDPPGEIGNYMDWLIPKLHGLDDPHYPSMVAVVVVPIRFPTPSAWRP